MKTADKKHEKSHQDFIESLRGRDIKVILQGGHRYIPDRAAESGWKSTARNPVSVQLPEKSGWILWFMDVYGRYNMI